MHPDVCHSAVYNRQDMEATSMSIGRGMDKEDVVHIYNGYYSTIKKNEIIPSATTWMDLEIVILSEVRQRRRNIIQHPLYVKSKKK